MGVPRRRPGPWPRGLLPPRRRLPALRVPPAPARPLPDGGGAALGQKRCGAEAAAGPGSRAGSQGGRARGGAPGWGLPGAEGRPAVPGSRGVEGCERCESLIRGRGGAVLAQARGPACPSGQRLCTDTAARPQRFPELLPSHSCSCRLQHWTLLGVSLLNCLLSTACSVGLALAFALTVHSRGTHLVRGCDSSALPLDAREAIATNDCPFNTTRIYVSRRTAPSLPAGSFCFLSSFHSLPPASLPLSLSPFFPLLSSQSLLGVFSQPGAVPTSL